MGWDGFFLRRFAAQRNPTQRRHPVPSRPVVERRETGKGQEFRRESAVQLKSQKSRVPAAKGREGKGREGKGRERGVSVVSSGALHLPS